MTHASFFSGLALLCFAYTSSASAAGTSTQPYCRDLYSAACSNYSMPEKPVPSAKQPSGAPSLAPPLELQPDSLVDRAAEPLIPEAMKAFRLTIDDVDQKYFRDIAAEVLAPECKVPPPEKRSSCQDSISRRLTDLAASYVSRTSRERITLKNIALEDLAVLTANSKFTDVLEKMRSDVAKSFKKPEFENRIKNQLFPEVKQRLIAKIRSMDIGDKSKNHIISKIRSVTFASDGCTDLPNSNLDLTLQPNAFFLQGKNRIHLCDGFYLEQQDDLSIITVLTHELVHGIDPCGIQLSVASEGFQFDQKNEDKADSQYPMPDLVKCLRHKDSIQAQRNNGDVIFKTLKLIGVIKPRMFCDDDQIGESLADWFAAEVAGAAYEEKNPNSTPASAVESFSRVWRPICGLGVAGNQGDAEHPAMPRRANRIFLMNPKVRTAMGCGGVQADAGYCDGKSPVPSKAVYGKVQNSTKETGTTK